MHFSFVVLSAIIAIVMCTGKANAAAVDGVQWPPKPDKKGQYGITDPTSELNDVISVSEDWPGRMNDHDMDNDYEAVVIYPIDGDEAHHEAPGRKSVYFFLLRRNHLRFLFILQSTLRENALKTRWNSIVELNARERANSGSRGRAPTAVCLVATARRACCDEAMARVSLPIDVSQIPLSRR